MLNKLRIKRKKLDCRKRIKYVQEIFYSCDSTLFSKDYNEYVFSFLILMIILTNIKTYFCLLYFVELLLLIPLDYCLLMFLFLTRLFLCSPFVFLFLIFFLYFLFLFLFLCSFPLFLLLSSLSFYRICSSSSTYFFFPIFTFFYFVLFYFVFFYFFFFIFLLSPPHPHFCFTSCFSVLSFVLS